MDSITIETLNSNETTEAKVKKLAKVTAHVSVKANVNKEDFAVVSAYLLKDLVAAYGSIRANKKLPELIETFIRKTFRARAKQIKLSIAKARVLAEHRDDWENEL